LRLITTYAEKEALIAGCGIDYLVVLPFDASFAAVPAETFVRDILVATIGVRQLIIGYDYMFGRNREGTTELLRALGTECGFEVTVLPPLGDGTLMYRSSTIRSLIAEGNVAGAVPLLGRYFSLSGRVVHGHHRGEGLGFPTANLVTEKDLLPPAGVYAVKVALEGALYDGACNIGTNPTFGDGESSIEVFLFDFNEDLYGRELRLFFVVRLREERRFSDVSLLKEAIAADVARCREILGRLGDAPFREQE
ncbi:MAG TPA: riboflavin biosynthesis protein RibF, partial [Geobacteraceae bacterium]